MQHNTCHGQCYLMKKLKNQQEKEQQNFKINLQESIAVNPTQILFHANSLSDVIEITYSIYTSNLNPREFIYSLDRPPLFV